MIQDLAALAATFPGSEWREAAASVIRETDLEIRRAARVLHDDAGQLLSAAGLHAGLVSMEDAATGTHLAECQNLLEQGMSHIRDISRALNPCPAGRAGLRFTLERLSEQYGPSFSTGVTLEYPANFCVASKPAIALGLFAGYCLEFVKQRDANSVHFRVIKSSRAYVLEVLYDVSSHLDTTEIPRKQRRDLLVLFCRSIQAGVAVEYGNGPDDGLIRATTEDQDCTI